MLGNLPSFDLCLKLLKHSFRDAVSVSSGLKADQARHVFRSEQNLAAGITSKQRYCYFIGESRGFKLLRVTAVGSLNHYSRVKSGIFGQTAKFGQQPCLFHSLVIGIKNKFTKQIVKILMRRLIRSRLMWISTVCKCVSEFT